MSLQDTIVNPELNNVDLSKIAGLQQKRTLAFVNHFLVTTVQFLNKFTRDCEEKLMHFERKLEKVNASMVLLESKLSSIPEINIPQAESPKVSAIDIKDVKTEPEHVEPETDTEKEENPIPNEPSEEKEVSPEYMRFVKMVQVGVPLQAVKLKMMLEGLDSTRLDKMLNK